MQDARRGSRRRGASLDGGEIATPFPAHPPVADLGVEGPAGARVETDANGAVTNATDSEERFRQLADAMPQLVWTARADGVVDYYNARAAEYDGLHATGDGAWAWEPVLHPDDVAATTAAWRRAVETEEPYDIEHRVRMRDGTFRWHISRGVPMRGVDGTLRWYGTATDIHAMRLAQDDARANEERLRQALLVADLGMFDHDHESGRIFWSDTMRQIAGVGAEETLTLDRIVELAHPDDRAAVAEEIARAHDPDGDGTYEVEYRLVRPDGVVRWVSAHSRTFFDEDGGVRRPRRTIGAFADVTERHEAEARMRENEERLRIATEVAAIGTYDIDLVGEESFLSAPLRAILGVAETGPLPALAGLVHPDDASRVEAAFRAATDPTGDGLVVTEHRIVRADCESRWVLDHGRVLFEEVGGERRATRLIGAVMDVTQRRETEELREAFIGMLSHELRTPVTSIYGGSQVLRRPGLDPELRDEILDGVLEESARLVRLVENLLVIAKVERNAELGEQEPLLLRPIVRRVVETARSEHPDTPIEVESARAMPTVEGDEGAVELVLRNLVSNAIKYGARGPVLVRAEEREDHVWVRVLDAGPGLRVPDPARLFDLFYRQAQAKRTAAGAGIGLYVVRALVRAMGGDVWARDRPEGGAEFGFALRKFRGVDEPDAWR